MSDGLTVLVPVPRRPGELAPVVDRSNCEGKAECVEVCPMGVFEVRRLEDADFARLGVFAKLKSLPHGRRTAERVGVRGVLVWAVDGAPAQ